jgi:two-component system response regulator FlrC
MRLLIIGQINNTLMDASKIAIDRGAKVGHVDSVEKALSMLRVGKGADLIMADVNIPIGILVQSLKKERFVIPVVACGVGENNEEKAVAAIQAGATEYIPLPPDVDLIAAILESVSNTTQTMLYKSEQMERVYKLAQQIAKSDASVLISGESGTGKEVLSKLVHKMSKRAKAPFISINCAAIPEHLLESELFGHEKGAFTGAIARRVGKFEEASGGTLFLDEISEMHIHLQAKLLRAIQERIIDPLGSSRPVKIDIRIIATTNRDLWEYVKEGKFREDLYFRLNVINIEMPALRDRKDDILFLADYFIEKYTIANGLPTRLLSEAAKRSLLAHAWPGNVRELENLMHRAVLMTEGLEIQPETLFPNKTNEIKATFTEKNPEIQVEPASLVGKTVAAVEKDLILSTLDHCLGNRTHAANILGISLRTLRNKLRLYKGEITENELEELR